MKIASQPILCGPFYAGDTGPALDLVFVWDTGSFVNLVGAAIEVNIRRWDSRTKAPIGPSITTGPAIIYDGINGRANYQWIYSDPVDTVPLDSGWYVLQATVILSNGLDQLSQRAIFEVLPA